MDDDAELDAIHQDLADDQVYVHSSLADEFSADELAEISDNLAAADETVFVVAYPFTPGDAYGGSPADLLTRLHAEHPDPGLYLATTERFEPTEYTDITLEARSWDEQGTSESYVLASELSIVRYEAHEDLGEAFVRATELLQLPQDELRELEENAREEWRESEGLDAGGAGPGDSDGSNVVGYVLGGLLVAVVLGAVVASRRRRKATEPLTLPASAVARIRKAHDRKLTEQARADVLALGELIDDAELAPDANASSWQAALDHYDAARSLLRDTDQPEVLDVVGAIVLADNGSRALADAQADRDFAPPVRCFLNPLHGEGSDRERVRYGDRDVKVPLCRQCRTDLHKDRTPDILDVEHRGRPVHYFETDAEPWASTGFGSLDPDLVRRLHGHR